MDAAVEGGAPGAFLADVFPLCTPTMLVDFASELILPLTSKILAILGMGWWIPKESGRLETRNSRLSLDTLQDGHRIVCEHSLV